MLLHIEFLRSTNNWIYVLFISPLFISVILSSPIPQPQFAFPNSEIFFSAPSGNDEYKDIETCLDDDYSMPHFDRTTGEFPCYKLLTQGPCDDGEWFVLDEEVRFSNNREVPTAKCKAIQCEPIATGKNSSTVMFNGKCTNVTSSEECAGDNMVVLVNPFGEGECGCKDNFVEWNPKSETELSKETKCYQEYLQGPCSSGLQLIPKEDVKLEVTVNNRPLDISLWFGLTSSQITLRENAENDFGSMCIPSDCEKEGYIRLKTGECIKPESCSSTETLIPSTEFTQKITETDGTIDIKDNETTSCCLSDEELKFRKYVVSKENGSAYEEKVKELLQKNACVDNKQLDDLFDLYPRFSADFDSRSALVTIPESCPRGQTITHDGECKHVRIWRSRPRRSSNSANRIRQMMRYVRALRRQRPGIE